MFDYNKFENDLVAAMEDILKNWAKTYPDLYILSLDCARDMTSVGIMANIQQHLNEECDADDEAYWYYKYCEDEWELFEAGGLMKEISIYMNQFAEENDTRFTDPETFEFTEAFEEHCDQMIDACEQAVQRLRQTIDPDFPKLLLAFNIREYLDAEARAAFFAAVNSKEASEEYAAHIEDFN
ncbi:MAG: DUF4303 domain-containing protein [Lachnospiraceae bacterium]|nr:DUF4303 domain-containing protein [Lachnospiraceae bacterium]